MADFLSKHLTKLEDGPDNTSTINKLVSEIKTFVDEKDTTVESMVQFTKKVTTQVKTQASIQSINYLSNSGWGEVYDMRDIILWAFTASGEINNEEVELYTNDDNAWKEELFHIWEIIHD